MVIKLMIFFTVIRPLWAGNMLGVPDSETYALYQLLSTSVSQLGELERLVTSAEKYTHRISAVNETIQDKVDTSERLLAYAEYHVDLYKEGPPEDLEALNSQIRSLKDSTANVKSLLNEVANSEREIQLAKLNDKKMRQEEEKQKSRGITAYRKKSKDKLEEIRINTNDATLKAAEGNRILNKLWSVENIRSKREAQLAANKVIKQKERKDFIASAKERVKR